MNNKDALRLYLVASKNEMSDSQFLHTIMCAISGGVTMVQLREKNISTQEYIRLGLMLKKIIKPLNVPLIINDRVDVAMAVDADGVHLGQSDMPAYMARKMMGKDKIIGLSIETLGQLLASKGQPLDYIAASPVFASMTKTDTSEPLGLDGVSYLTSHTLLPVVAIGGINVSNAKYIIERKAAGLAISSAIMGSESPAESARKLYKLWEE